MWRDGKLVGVEAVLDKDLTAALLGQAIGAEVLVIATDVAHAVIGFGTPHERQLDWVVPAELRDYAEQGHFVSGSMGPKVEAAIRFVEGGGRRAVITSWISSQMRHGGRGAQSSSASAPSPRTDTGAERENMRSVNARAYRIP